MADNRNARRTLTGVVVSAKVPTTIGVVVERTYKHARYGKFLRTKKKYMAHDPNSEAREGDKVEIAATRPISKLKRWRIVKVLTHTDLEGKAQSPDMELAAAAGEAEAAASEGAES